MEMGIPYTKRLKALVYDFKVEMPDTDTRIKSTGFSGKKTLRDATTPKFMCCCRNAGKTKTETYTHSV